VHLVDVVVGLEALRQAQQRALIAAVFLGHESEYTKLVNTHRNLVEQVRRDNLRQSLPHGFHIVA
jgi:hypothetical protein